MTKQTLANLEGKAVLLGSTFDKHVTLCRFVGFDRTFVYLRYPRTGEVHELDRVWFARRFLRIVDR